MKQFVLFVLLLHFSVGRKMLGTWEQCQSVKAQHEQVSRLFKYFDAIDQNKNKNYFVVPDYSEELNKLNFSMIDKGLQSSTKKITFEIAPYYNQVKYASSYENSHLRYKFSASREVNTVIKIKQYRLRNNTYIKISDEKIDALVLMVDNSLTIKCEGIIFGLVFNEYWPDANMFGSWWYFAISIGLNVIIFIMFGTYLWEKIQAKQAEQTRILIVLGNFILFNKLNIFSFLQYSDGSGENHFYLVGLTFALAGIVLYSITLANDCVSRWRKGLLVISVLVVLLDVNVFSMIVSTLCNCIVILTAKPKPLEYYKFCLVLAVGTSILMHALCYVKEGTPRMHNLYFVQSFPAYAPYLMDAVYLLMILYGFYPERNWQIEATFKIVRKSQKCKDKKEPSAIDSSKDASSNTQNSSSSVAAKESKSE